MGKKIGRVLVRIPSPAPYGQPRLRRPRRGAIADRRPLLLVAVLVCLLAAACTSPNGRQATATSQASAGPTRRDYWPTAGWQTATPKDEGMDPAVLDELDTKVPDHSPRCAAC